MLRPAAALLMSCTLSCAAAIPPAAAQDLASAVADALAHAPALAAAQAGADAADARVDQARAQGNPLLRVEGSYGAGRIDNGGYFGLSADNVTPRAAQAVAEMPLYAGGRVSAAIAQARGGAQAARHGAEAARLDTIVRAVAAYAEVLSARKLEARFRLLVDSLTEVERQAALRFRAGEIASSDLAQARARKAQGDAAFASAQGRRTSAEAAFARLTGKAAGDLAPLPGNAPGQTDPLLPAAPATLGEAIELARAHNPMLAQARAGTDAARAGARAARAEGLPTIGAYAEAAHVRDQFFPGYRADSMAVGLRGRWTLFAGGRVASAARAADAQVDQSEANERAMAQTLEGMVIDAWSGLATARRMAEAAALQSEAAAEALRGTRLEAQVGAKPVLAVLDAESDAAQAEAALIEAQAMRTVAAWQLAALSGAL